MAAVRRVVAVGGGPAGLLAAILLKEVDPGTEIEVLDRDPVGADYGFGLVFSAPALAALGAAVPWLRDELAGMGRTWSDIELRLRGERIRLGGNSFASVGRSRLLTLLRRRAEQVGVVLRHEHEVRDPEDLDADLVLGADGVSSTIRGQFAAELEPSVEIAEARYAWFGAYADFDALTFAFERTEHGWFAVHGYPFDGEGTCTFLVETDPQTWNRSHPTDISPDAAPGESDGAALRYCSEAFAGHLVRPELLGNNSVWRRFATVRTRRWSHSRYVLLGDAAHTAHFSVGSGTTMALQDAIALAAAMRTAEDLPGALRGYETERRPQVERLQAAAYPSMGWWKNYRRYLDMPLPQLGMHFLSRSGRVTHRRASRQDPEFVASLDRWFSGGEGVQAVLGTPFEHAERTLLARIVEWGAVDGAALLRDGQLIPNGDRKPDDLTVAVIGPVSTEDDVDEQIRRGVEAATDLVAVLADPAAREAGTVAQSHVTERLRLEHGVATILVDQDGDLDHAAQLVLSGRTDLVALPGAATDGAPLALRAEKTQAR